MRSLRPSLAVALAAFVACGGGRAVTGGVPSGPPPGAAGRAADRRAGTGTGAAATGGTGTDVSASGVAPGPVAPSGASAPSSGATGATGAAGAAGAAADRRFAVYRVDDSVDPLAVTKDADVPDGVELRVEMVPVGDRSKSVRVTYALARVQSGERPEAAAERLRAWVATVPHPFATWFALAPVADEPDGGVAQATGFRTLLVRDPVVVDDHDVVEAHVEPSASGGAPGGSAGASSRPIVRVTVRTEAAARLEQATREWVARRLAIVADGAVVAAPLILEAIAGGHATIPAVGPSDDARRAWAERFVRSLRP